MKSDVETKTRLELRVVSSPCEIICQGEVIKLEGRNDAGCLILITTCGSTIMSEEIVAVTTSVRTFLQLRAFAQADGGITLHRDLAS